MSATVYRLLLYKYITVPSHAQTYNLCIVSKDQVKSRSTMQISKINSVRFSVYT